MSFNIDYSREYQSFYPNGIFPDSKVIKTIKKHCPMGSNVADIGAGDGRNAIPLAKRGYCMDAFEPSEMGQIKIQKKAKKLPNLNILPDDITSSALSPEKYDGIYMARVSQHFYDFEMSDVLNNFYQGLKKGGTVLFDALVDKVKYPKRNDMDILVDVEEGCNHFKEGFIEKSAQKSGFDIAEVLNYKRDLFILEKYFGPKWGFGFDTVKDAVRPVQLKWFTLIKRH